MLKNIFVYDYQKDQFIYTGYYPEKIAKHLEMNGVDMPEEMKDFSDKSFRK